jgi:hypothetical protein
MDVRKEVQERLKSSTTPPIWKKIRNISGTIFGIGFILSNAGLSLPDWLSTTIYIITGISGVLSGRSHLAKKR